ncbi:MAG: HAMP domain-containing sensor histidine kinase [Collinsella sp.]|nr:HAMP domain-containing sensor histidine kinase [Collinsella sp.]
MRLASLVRSMFKSITVRCLTAVGIYAAFIALSVVVIDGVSDVLSREAFPDSSDIREHKQEIFDGEYDILLARRFNSCKILVLGEKGAPLYASSPSFARAIGVNELEFINDRSSGGGYFDVLEEERDGKTMYRVLWLGANEETGFEHVASYALLDSDLNIVEGPLFSPRSSLSLREFYLLLGLFEEDAEGIDVTVDNTRLSGILTDRQYVIDRIDGVSSDGEPRTIVFASPTIDPGAYARTISEAGQIWLALVPLIAVATIILFAVEIRIIRTALRPLSSAISSYGGSGDVAIDPAGVATELKPVVEGFVELTGRLDQAQSEKRRMIADISHDIKTPLTVIRGYAQAFHDDMVPADKRLDYLAALRDKADLASRMLESLARYSALEHPEYRVNLVPCDLSSIVRDVSLGLGPMADQHGCHLEVHVPDGPLPSRLDVELMERLVTNLVGNACIHNGPGTRVSVRCAAPSEGSDAGLARIEVLDTGSGVSSELARSLFEPFVTDDVARTSGKGTGLGLSIARRCAELNGGSLELVAQPEEPWSTCFVAKIPVDARPR